jgi:hypothetical protein
VSISAARWKVFIAVLGIVVALLYAWALSEWPRYSHSGSLGFSPGDAEANGVFPIARLNPDSPLAAAGAKVGDRIRLDHHRDTRRLLGAGEVIGLQIISPESSRHMEVTAQPVPAGFFAAGWGGMLTAFVSALALAIGIVIGVRRADQASIRFFAVAVLMQPLNYVNFRLPMGAVADFLDLVNPLAPFAVVYFCFPAFCLTFPDGQAGPARSRLRMLLAPCAALAIGIGLWGVGYNAGWIGTPITRVSPPFAIGSVILSLTALALAWRESTGTLRARIAWISVSMGLVYLSYLWGNAMAMLGLVDWARSQQYLSASAIAAGYFGLAYALMRHRLFDTGFVVNRALVYGAVSVAILLAFGLLEWLSHKLLHLENQEGNVLLDAGIALVVFLAFNKIHRGAEDWVERLFFQAWHRREEALRKFVKQAAHVVSPAALLESFRAALDRFCEGARCAIYLRAAGGTYRLHSPGEATPSEIAEDASLAVALRAEPLPTFLEGEHALEGMELALPMSHRGVLGGIVLLGRRPGSESYRPDEVEVLGFAAHQVGLDLHALEIERLRRELERAGLEIAKSNAKVEAYRSMLPRAIAPAE